jgi:hypothetical protein
MPIRAFLKDQTVEAAFEPDEIEAMSMALEDVCSTLKLDADAKAKEIVAIRIIELAGQGMRSRTSLREKVLQEARGGTRC